MKKIILVFILVLLSLDTTELPVNRPSFTIGRFIIYVKNDNDTYKRNMHMCYCQGYYSGWHRRPIDAINETKTYLNDDN